MPILPELENLRLNYWRIDSAHCSIVLLKAN